MKIGKISKDEKIIKLDLEIHCTNCGKKVPGGIKTGEKFVQSNEFKSELTNFLKEYLCGICRSKMKKSL